MIVWLVHSELKDYPEDHILNGVFCTLPLALAFVNAQGSNEYRFQIDWFKIEGYTDDQSVS